MSGRSGDVYDAVVIGAGFYGLSIALFLRDEMHLEKILVVEKHEAAMTRASYVNQARVHNGYHYPRSILTASRSAGNFSRFVNDYKEAIVNDFDKYYAIARSLSKVNARQFLNFSLKIGAKIEPAPKAIEGKFNHNLIEAVFSVQEYAFNSHILRDILLERIAQDNRIRIAYEEMVDRLVKEDTIIKIYTNRSVISAERVFNCTYAQINQLHRASGLDLVPMKHEVAEMCLIRLPRSLKNFSVTVMDGPFFSIMPFPSRGLHTLSHVRFTPHISWSDTEDGEISSPHEYLEGLNVATNFKKMKADVQRYVPELHTIEYVDSIVDVKTVLRKSEADDSRPILFRDDFGMEGYICIMGGKLDNIYDVFEEIKNLYGGRA